MALNKDRANAVWEGSVAEGGGRVTVASGEEAYRLAAGPRRGAGD